MSCRALSLQVCASAGQSGRHAVGDDATLWFTLVWPTPSAKTNSETSWRCSARVTDLRHAEEYGISAMQQYRAALDPAEPDMTAPMRRVPEKRVTTSHEMPPNMVEPWAATPPRLSGGCADFGAGEHRGGHFDVLHKDPPLVSSLLAGTGSANSYPTYDFVAGNSSWHSPRSSDHSSLRAKQPAAAAGCFRFYSRRVRRRDRHRLCRNGLTRLSDAPRGNKAPASDDPTTPHRLSPHCWRRCSHRNARGHTWVLCQETGFSP